MASVIADMALPGLTGFPLGGPAAVPEGFAALLAPAPAVTTPTAPLALPKTIDLAFVSALMPAQPDATGEPLPPAQFPTALPAKADPLETVAAPRMSLAPDVAVETTQMKAAEPTIASATPPTQSNSAEPAATSPDLSRQLENPAPTIRRADTPVVQTHANEAPSPQASALGDTTDAPMPAPAVPPAQTGSEPSDTSAAKPETPVPNAPPPVIARTPRLVRTLPLTPAIPNDTAPAPEAAPAAPQTSHGTRVEPLAEEEPDQPIVEEAEHPSQAATNIPPPPALPSPAEPAVADIERKVAPTSTPTTQPDPIAAPQRQAPAAQVAQIERDIPALASYESTASPREAATPANDPAAPAAPSPAPSFGEFVAPKPVATPPPPPQTRVEHPTPVSAHPDRIAPETAVAISRHLATGGAETITIRLDPVDMGRIEVRLSFDDSGALRGVIAADNPAALDLLRRDQAGLVASLSDAGVATDAQSFRFDTRSDDRGGQRQWTQRQPDSPAYRDDTPNDEPQPENYRPLISRGRVDVMA